MSYRSYGSWTKSDLGTNSYSSRTSSKPDLSSSLKKYDYRTSSDSTRTAQTILDKTPTVSRYTTPTYSRTYSSLSSASYSSDTKPQAKEPEKTTTTSNYGNYKYSSTPKKTDTLAPSPSYGKPKSRDPSPNPPEKTTSYSSYGRTSRNSDDSKSNDKDIPSKTTKVTYGSSPYSSYKLYSRNYTRPLQKDEPKLDTSRYTSSYTKASSYLDKPVVNSTPTPYTSQNGKVNGVTKEDAKIEHENKDQSESEDESSDEDAEAMISVTVVTRGTSPTAPCSSVYLRTRRADMAKTIEKTITRPKKRPKTADKEMQSDKTEDSTRSLRYASSSRVSPWSSYMDSKYSTPSRYSSGRYNSSSYSSSSKDEIKPSKSSEKIKPEVQIPSPKPDITINNVEIIKKEEEPAPIVFQKEKSPYRESSIPVMERCKSKSKSPTLTPSRDQPIPDYNNQLPPQVPKLDSTSPSKTTSAVNSINKTLKSTGKKIVKKVRSKDGEKEPKKRIIKRSVSTSSGEESGIPGESASDSNDSCPKKRTVKVKSASSKSKLNSESKTDSSDSNRPARKSSSVTTSGTDSTSMLSSSSSTEDDMEQTKLKSDSKPINFEIRRCSSSRTSLLASSNDEMPYDKSGKSPVSQKSDLRTEDAKSFLMRALAPVTSLFKMKSTDNSERSDIDQNTLNVMSIATDSEGKNDNNNNSNQEKHRITTAEKAWWLDSNSDKTDNKISEHEEKKLSSSEENNLYKLKLQKQKSGERAWWLESNGNIPEGIEVLPPSRKESTESDQSEKYKLYKIRPNESGERDWWITSESSKKTDSNNQKDDDKFATNGVKNRPNEASERDWWLTSESSKKTDSNNQNEDEKFALNGVKIRPNENSERDWWLTSESSKKTESNNQKDDDKFASNAAKTRSNEPSERDWWLTSESSKKTDSNNQNEDDKFTLNVVKIRHIESGERSWWMASNSNIPEGIQHLTTSEEDSSDNNVNGCHREEDYEEPLGDRKSPEGLETPHVRDEMLSQFCGHKPHKPRNLFISRHMDIDDILGCSSQIFGPRIDRILSRKSDEEIVEGDNSECREVNPTQVKVHDSTAKRPVIHRIGNRSGVGELSEGDLGRLDESALQVYKDGDFGPYLDLESSLAEQQEEMEGFQSNRKNSIVLRTKLSVRVTSIIEKLLTSEGRELRRALFSLKQVFQEDKDLVHEFVQNSGLECLIRVGANADQNYQNYILRALGQVMLYVDGMNGVMAHNASLQWLYSLVSSKYRLVVKTTLKLLLVFVEYVDTNCMLLIQAIEAVDITKGLPPWSNIMNLLKDYDASDIELLIYAMTLINKCLNGIPDQETYYNQTDGLEDQGMYEIIQRYMSRPGTDLDLLRQFQIYEAVLSHEDGDDIGKPLRQLDDSIRRTLRSRKVMNEGSPGRKSRRHCIENVMNINHKGGAPRYNHAMLQTALADDGDDEPLSPQSTPADVFRDSKDIATAFQRRRKRVQRQREFMREQQELWIVNKTKEPESIENDTNLLQGHQLYTSGLQQRIQNGTLGHSANGPKDLMQAVTIINKQIDEMDVSDKSVLKNEITQWKQKFNQNGTANHDDINYDDSVSMKKPMLQISKENSVKDLTEKLTSPIGTRNQIDDIKMSLVGEMTGVISKAIQGLEKSKSKNIIRSPTLDIVNKTEVKKTESDFTWDSIVASLDRPLLLNDLDFTDLTTENDDSSFTPFNSEGPPPPPPPPLSYNHSLENGQVPPPPPHHIAPPPTPIFDNSSKTIIPDFNSKAKKTIKLFWREIVDSGNKRNGESSRCLWDEIMPVKVDTKMLEHLFESRTKDAIKDQLEINKNKEVIVLDHKRSNAINILLKKLPPPQTIKNAILKMDATVLTREGIDKLMSMLPSEEETIKIQEAQVGNPSIPLGNAEQFLLTLASISELNARLKLWVFKLDFESAINEIAEPYMDLKLAMEIIQNNATFKMILSTLLPIGIFLNGAETKGFQIEYLSKIHEVKDTVHKHSLLHHLCHMVLDHFPESSDLYSEIGPVTRASKVNFEELSANIERLEIDCKASTNYLKLILKHDANLVKAKLGEFLHDCAERIIILGIVKKRLYARYSKFLLWLGIPPHRIYETRPSDVFKVISEFALEYRTTRERVIEQRNRKACHRERNKTRGKLITDMLRGPESADSQLKLILNSNDSDSVSFQTSVGRKRKDSEFVRKVAVDQVSGIEEVFSSLLTVKEKKSDGVIKRHSKSSKSSSYLMEHMSRALMSRRGFSRQLNN